MGRWGLRTEGPRIESRQVPGDLVGVFSSKIVIPVKNPKPGLGLCVIYHLKADVFIFTMISNLKQSLVPVLSYMLENMGRSQSESAKINTILCLKINRTSHYTEVVNVTLHCTDDKDVLLSTK